MKLKKMNKDKLSTASNFLQPMSVIELLPGIFLVVSHIDFRLPFIAMFFWNLKNKFLYLKNRSIGIQCWLFMTNPFIEISNRTILFILSIIG